MFTGIITEIGKVKSFSPNQGGARITLEAPKTASRVAIGSSVCVDGVCLTVVVAQDPCLEFDAVAETLNRSTLGTLSPGDTVNLETALTLDQGLDGHLVQGHVDAVGTISAKKRLADDSLTYTFDAPESILRYVVEKGSIAIDGISLTVTQVCQSTFSVALIPHTAKVTTLGKKEPGAKVNLESDLMAKYAEKLLGSKEMIYE